MKTVELFSGTKSFSKVMKKHGHSTLTIDNQPELEPDQCRDILTMNPKEHCLKHADILWASPPCTAFSVASIGVHWGGGHRAYKPKTDTARLGIKLAKQTLAIIEAARPKWWFIENPRGVLRKMPFMQDIGFEHTIWYCHYGDDRAKPTTIWTNAYWWKPKPECHNRRAGHPSTCCCHDHQSAPRGAKTGTQGIDGARDRGQIPPALFTEILRQMPR